MYFEKNILSYSKYDPIQRKFHCNNWVGFSNNMKNVMLCRIFNLKCNVIEKRCSGDERILNPLLNHFLAGSCFC